ncbi:MAG: hypothetical protein ABJ092_01990 [Gillisia sp.]
MHQNISLEEMAENFRNLTPSEKMKLRSLLGDEWFVTSSDKEREIINSLIEKSVDQHRKGETKSFDNILQESRKKYGL